MGATGLDVLLVPVGSAGDVHPLVGIGRELRSRGHRVTLAGIDLFEELARGCGFDFVSVGASEDFERVLRDPRLWSAGPASLKLVMRATAALLPRQHAAVLAHLDAASDRGRRPVVIAGALAFGARVARDQRRFPLVTLHLSPTAFQSTQQPCRFVGLFMPSWLPRPLVRAQWWAANRVGDHFAGPTVNSLRREQGLAPVRDILAHWMHAPELVLAMFPDWFAPMAADWPTQVRQTGFPLYDEAEQHAPGAAWEQWIERDGPPIVFAPGSANAQARGFFEAAAEACAALGRPGFLMTRFADQVPARLPPKVRHVAYAPFSALLPRAAAIVHHGGVGTTAQAIASGRPQLVRPLAFDQQDNAARVRALGLGLEVSPSPRGQARRLERSLGELLADARFAERGAQAAQRLKLERPLPAGADLIEQTVEAFEP